jgi:hypothetical protein
VGYNRANISKVTSSPWKWLPFSIGALTSKLQGTKRKRISEPETKAVDICPTVSNLLEQHLPEDNTHDEPSSAKAPPAKRVRSIRGNSKGRIAGDLHQRFLAAYPEYRQPIDFFAKSMAFIYLEIEDTEKKGITHTANNDNVDLMLQSIPSHAAFAKRRRSEIRDGVCPCLEKVSLPFLRWFARWVARTSSNQPVKNPVVTVQTLKKVVETGGPWIEKVRQEWSILEEWTARALMIEDS